MKVHIYEGVYPLIKMPKGRKEEKMKKLCRVGFSMFLAVIVLCASITPAFATTRDGASARLTNCSTPSMSFGVAEGEASFYVSYMGREETFVQAKLTVQIQKKFLGLFWRDAADEWVGYSTEVVGQIYDDIPIDGAGTYRAVFKLEVFGSTGVTDVIEDTLQYKYT